MFSYTILAIRKRRRTQDIIDISTDDRKTKKRGFYFFSPDILDFNMVTKKTILETKPLTTTKAQLFKVQSNRLLKENLTITNYQKDPFFEDE